MKTATPKPKGRMLLYVALLMLALWCMFGLRTCTSDSPFRQSEQKPSGGDTLDVAIEYSPLSLYRYSDTLGGFNYDLIRLLADSCGLSLKFHPVSNHSAALERLANGDIDILVADIPVTSDVENGYLFTEPTFLDRQVLIQRMDSTGKRPVKGRLDLADRQVHVSRGSSAGMRLRNLSSEIGDTIYVVEDSINGSEQLFLLVAGGQVDLAVINEAMARRLSERFPDVDISTEVSFTQFQSWVLRKSDAALKQRIDTAIIRFKQTPAYRTLLDRYTK